MAHYGLLREYRFADIAEAEDIRGAKIYGRNDEKLGTIDDVIFDHSTGDIRFVVVDAGGWFSSEKFLVPAHRLHTSAEHEQDFSVNLDKDQIKNLPRYNESDLRTQEHWESYEKRYSDAWHAGPVQHREGSDRNLTPTPREMPAEPGSIGSQVSDEERARVSSRITPPLANDMTIQHNAVGLGDRWTNFEERLRSTEGRSPKHARLVRSSQFPTDHQKTLHEDQMGHARRYLIEAVDDYRLNSSAQQIVNACAAMEEVRLKTYCLKVQTINCERLRHRGRAALKKAPPQ